MNNNKSIKNIFFDLDGTIIDSYQGIKEGLQLVTDHYGIEMPEENYRKFIGPPLSESFPKYFKGIDVEEALAIFRRYYISTGKLRYKLFDGVKEMLTELNKFGYRLFIATSKREEPAKEILAHAGIIDSFVRVFGAGVNNRKEKREVLEYAFAATDLNRSESVLIGDTMYDVEGARDVGIRSLAVLYGFGDRDELIASDSIAHMNTPMEVAEYFLKQ